MRTFNGPVMGSLMEKGTRDLSRGKTNCVLWTYISLVTVVNVILKDRMNI